MRDDRLRLADTLEAIGQIEKYSQSGRAAFDENELIRVWILHDLQIIGEACRGLSDDFRKAHPDELWSDVVGFRNVLVHKVLWDRSGSGVGSCRARPSRAEEQGS